MSKLTSIFHRFNLAGSHSGTATVAPNVSNSYSKTTTKDVAANNEEGLVSSQSRRSSEEPEADAIVGPGEVSFEQATAGGLGRHLGLWSTTFLM